MSIPLYEDFDNPVGQFVNYDTYDGGQRTQLLAQKHTDIRSFEPNPILGPYPMFALDQLTMGDLDGAGSTNAFTMALMETYTMGGLDALTMSDLDGAVIGGVTMGDLDSNFVFRAAEPWTAGVLAPQSDRNHFNGISLACPTGLTTTASLMSKRVDISAYANTDYLSLSCPALPFSSLTLASCFFDLTSNPDGDFTTGPTDSLAFSTSTTTLSNADCELRFPLSAVTHIDRTAITGVRFRIQATSCSFRCLAIRCIATSWSFAPLDQNTLYGRLGATVPPSGSLSQSYTFPVAGAPVTPSDWPIALWSDDDGPEAVDIDLGAFIHTGTNAHVNTLTFYLRELPIIPNTMLMLDASTMGDLDGLARQPDHNFATLDDFANTRFMTVSLQWGSTGLLHIKDDAGNGYDFSGITLSTHSDYYLTVHLEDNSIRARIFPTDDRGRIDWSTVVFDSTAVIDSGLLPRRRGRVGWYAQILEGDSYVSAVRPRRTVYGEYRTAPLASSTPVEGAQLYASTSADLQLYGGASPYLTTTLSLDVTKSKSGKCIKVVCGGIKPLEGLFTSAMRFEDFYDSVIEFDVLAPSNTTLLAMLAGEYRFIGVGLPPLSPNHWTHIRIPLRTIAETWVPGPYQLYVLQSDSGVNTWYIDNIIVRTRSVAWEGRGQAADPWRANDPLWVPFEDTLNDPYNAALLGRGHALQVRAQVVSQSGTVVGYKVLPKYATLGNLIWPDEAPTYGSAPSPSFTHATFIPTPHSLSFDASASTAASGILAYHWSFGDGLNDFGEIVHHQYPTAGSYSITLTVIDDLGQKASTTTTVTVT